jgi:cytochrome c peroxidase
MSELTRLLPLFPVLLLPACGGGSSSEVVTTGPPAASAEVTQLRTELVGAGITALPARQTIPDELFAPGQALFLDKLFSGNQDVSCSTSCRQRCRAVFPSMARLA